VGKLEGKRPIGRLRRKWKDKVKTEHGGIVWQRVLWIYLTQDREK
jgi:hypothetical protein